MESQAPSNEFNKIPRVVVFGATGSGKSTFLNAISGSPPDQDADETQQLFKVSGKGTSCTSMVKQVRIPWFGNQKFAEVFLVDSCGFGDSSDDSTTDAKNIEELILILRRLTYVNCFLLVLNGESPRLDAQTKNMLKAFKKAFRKEAIHHVAMVFTRWSYDNKAERKRQKAGYSKELRINEINEEMQKIFEVNLARNIPCYFVDSLDFTDTIADDEEKQSQIDEFLKIQAICTELKQFKTMDLDEYQSLHSKLTLYTKKEQEKQIKEKEQKAMLNMLEKQHPQLTSILKEMEAKTVAEKVKRSTSVERGLERYFDSRDPSQKGTLAYEIWRLCTEYNKNDDSTRFSKGNFSQDLQKYVHENLGKCLEALIKNLLETEILEFQKNYKEIVKNFASSMDIPLDTFNDAFNVYEKAYMIEGGVATVLAASVAATLGELGLLAAAAVGGIVLLIVAAGGVLVFKDRLIWKRENVIDDVVKDMTDKIATNASLKGQLGKIGEKALNTVMENLIYQAKEGFIAEYQHK